MCVLTGHLYHSRQIPPSVFFIPKCLHQNSGVEGERMRRPLHRHRPTCLEEYIGEMRKGNIFMVILSQTNSLPTIEAYLYEKEWIEEEEHRLLSLYWKNF